MKAVKLPRRLRWHTRKPARASTSSDASPVRLEVEGNTCGMRLRITEDRESYGVMAEFAHDATCFAVELDGNRVLIEMRKRSAKRLRQDSAAPTLIPLQIPDVCCLGQLSLAFPTAINAAASRGEYAAGLLHLRLGKGTTAGSQPICAAKAPKP